jgi:hypothetical protein
MITMTAGAMVRGEIRRGLELLQFEGEISAFHESKRFLDSDFHVRKASRAAIRRMQYWERQLEQD